MDNRIQIYYYKQSYECMDAFCDEKGNINTEFSRMEWKVVFNRAVSGTRVDVEIKVDSEEALEKIIEIDFIKTLMSY